MGDSIRDELRSLIQEVQVQNKAPVILVESRLEGLTSKSISPTAGTFWQSEHQQRQGPKSGNKQRKPTKPEPRDVTQDGYLHRHEDTTFWRDGAKIC